MPKLVARTKRLILRPYERGDYEAWRNERLGRGPKRNEFDRGPVPERLLGRKEFLLALRTLVRAQKKDLFYSFGIFHRRTGECMGRITLGAICRRTYQFANLGYELSNQYWGHGYAAEAVRGVYPLAFKTLKLHRLEAGIEPHNTASRKVAERAGMKLESKRDKYYFDGKKWLDLVYYRILSEDLKMPVLKPSVKVRLRDYL